MSSKFPDCESCVFDGVEAGICSDCTDAGQWEEDLEREHDEVSEVLKIVDEAKHNHPSDCTESKQESTTE